MPLVKSGQIVEDQFVRVPDDAPIPDGVPVIVSGARFLAEADDLVQRGAPVGVLWPNDRRVAELAPWLDRISLVALVFPKFRDGRAYSQARLLRERFGYRRELRATGDVLRDQFQFLLRAGFDAFEVKKPADAKAFTEAAARFTRVLSAERRRPLAGAPAAVAGSRRSSTGARGGVSRPRISSPHRFLLRCIPARLLNEDAMSSVAPPVVAIIAPGAMGAGVGKRLTDRGATVLTSLAGRSAATVARAKAAGMAAASDEEIAGCRLCPLHSCRRAMRSRWRGTSRRC